MGILFFLPLMTMTPHTYYQLEYGSPQPDFKSAYTYIQEHIQPDDIIISPYTPLDMWYLGKSDYWIKFSLTGKSSDIAHYTQMKTEWYTNTPIIQSREHLEEITSIHTGYILVDAMFLSHTDGLYYTFLSETYELVFEKKENPTNSIWVYHFEPKTEDITNE